MRGSGYIQRAAERHDADFDIAVAMLEGSYPVSSESAVLKNISVGGLCFISSDPGLYSVGGKVALDINLSDDNPGGSFARGMGTIVWIGAGHDGKGRTSIGVSMHDLISMDGLVRTEDRHDG